MCRKVDRNQIGLWMVAAGVATAALLGAGCNELFPKRSAGEKLWRARCAECHGFDGRGTTPRYMGNPLADITDDASRHGTDATSMAVVIREGIPGQMPANSDLRATEMKELLAWIRHLRAESR